MVLRVAVAVVVLVKPWIAALIPLPFALIVRFASYAWWSDLAAAALYIAGYFIAWRVVGLERTYRAVLDQLFQKKSENSGIREG